MKRLVLAAMLAAFVLMIAGQALALNPQAQGRDRRAVPGGTKVTLTFGPVSAGAVGTLPTGYVLHSGDGAEFWYNTYYMNGSTITIEPVGVKVPGAITIVAPEPLYANGNVTHRIVVNAAAVSDSVFVDPMYGGLGK